MKNIAIILSASLGLLACSSESGRSKPRLVEAEVTIVDDGNTTISRAELSYAEDSTLREVVFFVNGERFGSEEFQFQGNYVVQRTVYDREGDRADIQLAYEDGMPVRMQRVIPGISTTEWVYAYQEGNNDTLRRVTQNYQEADGGESSTTLHEFGYDEDSRLVDVTRIQGSYTSNTSYRYDVDGRLERRSDFSQSEHVATYTTRYDDSGRVIEVQGEENQLSTIEYNDDGLISTIYTVSPGAGRTVSVRYRYGSGGMKGLAILPQLPVAELFDMAGLPFTNIDVMTYEFSHPGDIPSVEPSTAPPDDEDNSGGGGGSGGSGSGGSGSGGSSSSCEQYEVQNNCDLCLYSDCCAQLVSCDSNSDCLDFYDCAVDCSDQDCVDYCEGYYVTGSNLYYGYANCANTQCSAVCE